MEYMPDENRPIRAKTQQYHEYVFTNSALNLVRCIIGEFLEEHEGSKDSAWNDGSSDLKLLRALHDDMLNRHQFRNQSAFLHGHGVDTTDEAW